MRHLSALTSLYSLQKNIEAGDVVGSLTAGAQTISYGATAYVNMLGYNSMNAAVEAGAISTETGAALQTVGESIPYLSLVNDLVHGNGVGIVIDVIAIAFPPAAPFLAIASLIFGGLFGGGSSPPPPWGSGRFVFNSDGSLGLSIAGDHGGEGTVRTTLQNFQTSLQGVVANFQGQDPDAKIGIVANRLASLSYNNGTFALIDLDPATGADRTIHYDGSGKPLDATVGAPEYFRSMGEQFIYSALGREAIAPQWEVETARLQTQAGDAQAGLTELQRTQRNNQLAAATDKNATTQTWRPILLDLNGDGVQTVSQANAHVAFDVDSSGYLKNTAWAGKQDGFLVLDRNYNSMVDNGAELFSNSLVADAAKGLASMRWVDANADGDISALDPVYSQLRIWQDANGNGTVDNGETKSLADLGITALHYGRGSYDKGGQTFQMASPDLAADAVGTKTHAVDGSIIVQSSDGDVSLIVTKTEDLSNIAPGKDRINNGIEDTPLDILASDLLKNDKVGATGAALAITGVADARHGSVSLQNGVVHFNPEANYFGNEAGFNYTVRDANGNTAMAAVDITLAAVNDAPVVTDVGNTKTPIYGYQYVGGGEDNGPGTLECHIPSDHPVFDERARGLK